MQSSGESYGGLTEDSLGDAYNSSKDSTLVMREVTNMHAHTQTCLHTYKTVISVEQYILLCSSFCSPNFS